MTSEMNVIFLVVVIGALIAYSYVRKDSKEGFQVKSYTTNDLVINTCPSFASEVQTAKGSTDCCVGDLIDGKCTGNTFCTKSPAYAGVQNCVDAWRSYFKQKGDTLCPATMPNYFENILNQRAPIGCSSSAIQPSGSDPTDPQAKRCLLYKVEESVRRKIDSCDVEKRRANIQCPIVNGRSPDATINSTWWRDSSILFSFSCNYPFEPGVPLVCYDRKSLTDYLDAERPNWKNEKAVHDWIEQNVCENYLNVRKKSKEAYDRYLDEKRQREEAERRRAEAERRMQEWMDKFRGKEREIEQLRRSCRR